MIDHGRGQERIREASPSGAQAERCRRCGGTSRLILGDGPAICRVCLMAWVWLARAVTSGETIAEPDIATMRHLDHRRPRIDCLRCRVGRSRDFLGRLDERSRPL